MSLQCGEACNQGAIVEVCTDTHPWQCVLHQLNQYNQAILQVETPPSVCGWKIMWIVKGSKRKGEKPMVARVSSARMAPSIVMRKARIARAALVWWYPLFVTCNFIIVITIHITNFFIDNTMYEKVAELCSWDHSANSHWQTKHAEGLAPIL